jgi:hypothetical protein
LRRNVCFQLQSKTIFLDVYLEVLSSGTYLPDESINPIRYLKPIRFLSLL